MAPLLEEASPNVPRQMHRAAAEEECASLSVRGRGVWAGYISSPWWWYHGVSADILAGHHSPSLTIHRQTTADHNTPNCSAMPVLSQPHATLNDVHIVKEWREITILAKK